jgi:hypothetical protein
MVQAERVDFIPATRDGMGIVSCLKYYELDALRVYPEWGESQSGESCR